MHKLMTLSLAALLLSACAPTVDPVPGSGGAGGSCSSSSSAGGSGGEGGSEPCPECTSCSDNKLNGGETDIDCGGSWNGMPWGDCPRCQLGQGCYFPSDCASGFCLADQPGTYGVCAPYPECLTCEQSLSLHEKEEHCSEDEATAYQALIECACDADPFYEIPECGDNFCDGLPASSACSNALAAEFSGGCHVEFAACMQ
ncbi:hypothetical protein [Polyangium spumosum]|uniref:Kazal-like domain-containing protein n=1 Tax=Polyangium spumosum TaxID=889282 RepID=A0A6N7Q4M0_9BACT|nr:hypothetical protein [Polyangium spumosum]MRG98196.1 hypothetical protein [Polyangium spumosum]